MVKSDIFRLNQQLKPFKLKFCRDCRQVKKINLFYVNSLSLIGTQNYKNICKKCDHLRKGDKYRMNHGLPVDRKIDFRKKLSQ